MKDVSQLEISLEDAARALLRERGITEGWWMLSFDFEQTKAVIGPGAEEARPAVISRVSNIVLIRVRKPSGTHPPFVVNAAEQERATPRRKGAEKKG